MRFALLLSAAILTSSASAAEPAPGFKLPPGFEITQYAGPELANDIYTLHIDADGRIVVAGRGYVRQLIDTDNDGKADKAVELIPAPKLRTRLPFLSKRRIGSSCRLTQSFCPQRSATQMLEPSLSISTALREPQTRPAGILKKPSTVRYWLGASFVGAMFACAETTTGAARRVATSRCGRRIYRY